MNMDMHNLLPALLATFCLACGGATPSPEEPSPEVIAPESSGGETSEAPTALNADAPPPNNGPIPEGGSDEDPCNTGTVFHSNDILVCEDEGWMQFDARSNLVATGKISAELMKELRAYKVWIESPERTTGDLNNNPKWLELSQRVQAEAAPHKK